MKMDLNGKSIDYSKLILYPKEMDEKTRHELSEKLKELDIDFEYEEYR